LRTAERRDDIQSTEMRGFYTGGIEPQDTCEVIQVQYNRQTQESIIDVDVVEWEQAEMAERGGIVVVCAHNRNVDLTPARGSKTLSVLGQTSLRSSTTPSTSSSAKTQARLLQSTRQVTSIEVCKQA
jgi:hypothetical protein